MSRYVTLGSFRAYLSPDDSLGTTQNTLLQSSLDAAERLVDDYTRRNFLGTAGTVYYNRYSQNLVRDQGFYLREDIVSLTSITNGDGQNIPIGSVWLEPRNAGPPYRIARLKSSYVYTWNTDSDVIFAGTFGYGTAVPPAVTQAVLEYAAYIFRTKDVGTPEVAGFPEGGEISYPRGMPTTVRWKLEPYRSKSGGVV